MRVLNMARLSMTTNRLLSIVCRRSMSSQHQSSSFPKLALLTKRGVLEVHGRDSSKLLQGLITNDMLLLTENDHNVMHTYVLNIQGRIMYDLFIYRCQQQQDGGSSSFLVECDLAERDNLLQHLKRYKLRSKVKFLPREDLNVYSMFGDGTERAQMDSLNCDPRLKAIGARLITDNGNLENLVRNLENTGTTVCTGNDTDYLLHRFCMGVSEGHSEVSNGIPLEHNGAFLNSISFQKGCYVGQELVARAHFTGVIRKRVMPLTFKGSLPEIDNIQNLSIYNEKNKRVGKLLGVENNIGIGLMRLKESLSGDSMRLKLDDGEEDVEVTAKRPSWWPESLEY